MTFNRYISDNIKNVVIEPFEKFKIPFPTQAYDVLVPSEAFLIPGENRRMAIINGELKEQKFNSMRRCVLKIDQMLEIYSEGYQISLVFPEDAADIYFKIENYLKRIQEVYANGNEDMYNFGDTVLLMDKFASSIYDNNGKTLQEKASDGFGTVKVLREYRKPFIAQRITPIGENSSSGIDLDNNIVVNRYTDTHVPIHDTSYVNGLNEVRSYDRYEEPKMDFSKDRESIFDNINKIKAKRNSLKQKELVDVKDSYGKFNL